MNYLSLCSGIEAATCAWHSLGWRPVGFSEVEPFPCAVLAHHYPDIPNYGDIQQYDTWPIATPIDLLVGGTPCQSFSVAGLRKGLRDPRGNLALVYLALVDRFRPRWVVWENVPGVLSSNKGRDFGAFVGALAELGYGWAYRIVDAQYVRVDSHRRAVPQRRRRVFVVGYLGDWRPSAAVLFEPAGLCGNTPPRRTSREEAAGFVEGGAHGLFRFRGFGDYTESKIASTMKQRDAKDSTDLVVESGRARRVRRLTPLECERAQGFPDGWTDIEYRGKPAKNGPRYKAIGNSMAVNVMRWLGRRIKAADAMTQIQEVKP